LLKRKRKCGRTEKRLTPSWARSKGKRVTLILTKRSMGGGLLKRKERGKGKTGVKKQKANLGQKGIDQQYFHNMAEKHLLGNEAQRIGPAGEG